MYNAEQISKAVQIYYHLLQFGELTEAGEREYYKAYSENEEIMIKTTIDESFVTVCFENKGEMIDPEDLDRIFDRFFKVEKSRTSNSTGSGLGLAICKNIINLHKGSIWADCEGDIVRFFIKLNKQTSNIEWNFNAFN